MYMFHVCWTYVHMQHALKCLSIMFLYLDEFWTKQSLFEKSKFGKIQVLVFGNFSITQKWFKMFDNCVKIFITYFYIIYYVRN